MLPKRVLPRSAPNSAPEPRFAASVTLAPSISIIYSHLHRLDAVNIVVHVVGHRPKNRGQKAEIPRLLAAGNRADSPNLVSPSEEN